MKYFGNYIDDAVIREDESGDRYIKLCDGDGLTNEQLAHKKSKIAYGGESYGCFHIPQEITKEQYDSFGKTWKYGKAANDIIPIKRSYE
ncbi:hypothetical protein [Bacteroides sp. 51]|uniref:hypothetical protein n=1 Tax=Bacteroides sp. 51 TaxID=2302938 RepID=UPI0013D53BC7|nr:hypothetical protein [Bacteroides sp. 51]NDV82233.1 hypothetical protein [Bacteroides sp. 51]